MAKSTLVLPSPSLGTQRSLVVHRYGNPGARPKAYFQAALHADEIPGLLVAHHLLRLLEKAEAERRIRGEVIVVPVANPIGLGQHINGYLLGRFDLGAAGNFNRGFPSFPNEPMLNQIRFQLDEDPHKNASLIRKVLLQTIAKWPRIREIDALKATLLGLSIDADLVFDLHCDSEALLHLYASKHHRDTAVELGRDMGAAVMLLEEEPGGSPFDEANAGPWWKLRAQLANDRIPLSCFATTVELRGRADVCDDFAERDAAHLFRFLQRRGVINGDPGLLPEALCAPTPLEGVDILGAPAAGVMAYQKALGDGVSEGEVVAELVDPTADDPSSARLSIRSRTEGVLFARSLDRLVRPGQSVCKIAGIKPLTHRQLGRLLED